MVTRKSKPKVFKRPVSLFHALGRRLPPEWRQAARVQLDFAGQADADAEAWLGSVIVAGFLFGLVAFLAAYILLRLEDAFLLFTAGVGGFFLAIVTIYTYLSAIIEDRKNRIERILPDALQITAANVRAGMTPLVALRYAARPEFGPMEEEINNATARSLGTESFTDVLNRMKDRIPSPVFARSIALLAASLRGGGKMVELLDRLAEDIREMQELKSELVTNTSLYVLFIVFTVAIGTPLLLAVSFHFTNLVAELQRTPFGASPATETTGIGISLIISSPLSQEFVFTASLVVMVITSLLASALIGSIREGSEVSGLKYAPFLILASIFVFYIMRDFVLQFLRAA